MVFLTLLSRFELKHSCLASKHSCLALKHGYLALFGMRFFSFFLCKRRGAG